MKNIDLSILKKKPEPSLEVILEIQPLAPLSMVSEMPGSYYKTLKSPSKKMISGLFENVLGWHISLIQRKNITKELSKIRKKQKIDYVSRVAGSTYLPLLMEYFNINLDVIPPNAFYDDLWSKAYRRADASVHPKGTFNIDFHSISLKRGLKRNEKKPKQVEDKALEIFFKQHLGDYPQYYSSPTNKEYIVLEGNYKFQLTIDEELFSLIKKKLEFENIGYLGNSEGWVNIKIEKL